MRDWRGFCRTCTSPVAESPSFPGKAPYVSGSIGEIREFLVALSELEGPGAAATGAMAIRLLELGQRGSTRKQARVLLENAIQGMEAIGARSHQARPGLHRVATDIRKDLSRH